MMKSVGEKWARGDEIGPFPNSVDHPWERTGSQSPRQRQDTVGAAAVNANAPTQPRDSASSSLHDLPSRTSPLKPPVHGTLDSSKATLTPVPTHQNDDPSLHSFGNSFDMLSETDQFSFSDRGLSPTETHRSRNRRCGMITSPAGAFVSRDLKPNPTDATDSFSFGDLSPIKLVYHSNGALSEACRADDGSALERNTYGMTSGGSDEISGANAFLAGRASVSNPFYVLRSVKQAFQRCKYLLPCLREPEICPVNVSKSGPFHHYRCDTSPSPSSIEMKVAERRVETAVCAFGGYLDPLTRTPPNDESSPSIAASIFRLRGDALKRQTYDTCLPKRYTLNGSVVSWEVEESPPVAISLDPDSGGRRHGGREARRRRIDGFFHEADANSDASQTDSTGNRRDDAGDCPSKLKYRCKLCGQPKQNHACPYRHSLHRSIGVMVYPAVNSFTAAEPGTVAPPLSHMNNFVSYDSTHSVCSPAVEGSSQAMVHQDGLPPPHRQFHQQLTVTPASIQTPAVTFHSPQSSLSQDHSDEGAHHPTPSSSEYPPSGKLYTNDQPGSSLWTSRVSTTPNNRTPGLEGGPTQQQDRSVGRSWAFHHPSQPYPEPIFVESFLLRPEHYRAITPFPPPSAGSNESRGAAAGGSYRYPVIPLTFAERKRLSDSLFYLSQGLPTSTEDCARLLREARKAGEWDLAVAELLAQVVVGLYCGEGDTCLDGLQMYLLGLGVAC